MRKFMIACGLLLLATVSTLAQENRGVEVSAITSMCGLTRATGFRN